MIKTRGFVIATVMSFTATKLLQRGLITMSYEVFQEGEWVYYQASQTKRVCGFVLEDQGKERVKVQLVDKEYNTHADGYRFTLRGTLTRAVTENNRFKVEQFLKPFMVDFFLMTGNKEEFDRLMKGDAAIE